MIEPTSSARNVADVEAHTQSSPSFEDAHAPSAKLSSPTQVSGTERQVPTEQLPRWRDGTFPVIVAGLALVVVLALRLASVALNGTLSSDVLYPHLFAQDLLNGAYPSGGWSFGGATFFFPDYLLYLPILAATGPGGESFAVYAVGWFLALVALVAAVARWWADCGLARAWLAGVLTALVLLMFQFLPGHTHVLWWLPLPGYHGGTLLNGLALVALAGRGLRMPPPGRVTWWLAGALLWLGTAANTLLLIQFSCPVLLAVWWLERRAAAPTGLTRRLALLGTAAVAGVFLLQTALASAHWGYFLRLKPLRKLTPSVVWEGAEKFLRDAAQNLAPHIWAWLVALVIWLALAAVAACRRRPPGADLRLPAFHLLVATSITLMLAALVVSGWWIDWSNARYLLNVLLLPTVALAVAIVRALPAARVPRATWLTALLLAGSAGLTAACLRPEHWKFRPTPAALEYAKLVKRHNLHHGLAGYWQANLLNTLTEPPGTHRLGQLLGNGSPHHWCNNSFWYFEPAAADGTLRWRNYDFILTNGLDRAAILVLFGAPAKTVTEGAWEIFIYDEAGQKNLREALMPLVVKKLGPERLRGLRPVP